MEEHTHSPSIVFHSVSVPHSSQYKTHCQGRERGRGISGHCHHKYHCRAPASIPELWSLDQGHKTVFAHCFAQICCAQGIQTYADTPVHIKTEGKSELWEMLRGPSRIESCIQSLEKSLLVKNSVTLRITKSQQGCGALPSWRFLALESKKQLSQNLRIHERRPDIILDAFYLKECVYVLSGGP